MYAANFIAKTNYTNALIDKTKEYIISSDTFELTNNNNFFICSIKNYTFFKINEKLLKLIVELKKTNKAFTYNEYLEIIHESILKDLIRNRILVCPSHYSFQKYI